MPFSLPLDLAGIAKGVALIGVLPKIDAKTILGRIRSGSGLCKKGIYCS